MLILVLMLDLIVGVTSQPRPNFVILMVDDMGSADVGCFGNRTIPTPNIDRLCADGVKLSHHVAADAVCTPSRSAFLSGRHAHRVGMYPTMGRRVIASLGDRSGLSGEFPIFSEVFSQAGYRTGLTGKWHQGLNCDRYGDFCYHPNSRGFHSFYGLPLSNLAEMGAERFPVDQSGLAYAVERLFFRLVLLYIARRIVLSVVRRPVFLFELFFMVLNGWLLCTLIPECYIERFLSVLMANETVVEMPYNLKTLNKRFLNHSIEFISSSVASGQNFLLFHSFHQLHVALAPDAQFSGKSSHGPYGDTVLEVDWTVGRIVDHLRQLGKLDDTFIYFTSDHGGNTALVREQLYRMGGFNGEFSGGKLCNSFEGGVRVPGIVQLPSRFSRKEVAVPTSLMDVFPTMMELAGLDMTFDLDGKSLVPLLEDRSSQDDTKLEHHKFLFDYCGYHIHAVRYTDSGRVFKAVFARPLPSAPKQLPCNSESYHWFGEEPLLYDLVVDPGEQSPLSQESTIYRRVVAEILAEKSRREKNWLKNPEPSQLNFLNMQFLPYLQPFCGSFPYFVCSEKVAL